MMFSHKFDSSASVALQPSAPVARLCRAAGTRAREGRSVGALIIGGDHGSLGVARSLGRRGIPVWFLTDDKIIAKFSRYTERTVYWDGPEELGAIEYLDGLAVAHGLTGWVLYPAGDREVKLVAQNHAALSRNFKLITPPWEITQIAADKHLMYERAAALGVAYPKSYYPRNRAELSEIDYSFPAGAQAFAERRREYTDAGKSLAHCESCRAFRKIRHRCRTNSRRTYCAAGIGHRQRRDAILLHRCLEGRRAGCVDDRAAHPPISDRIWHRHVR